MRKADTVRACPDHLDHFADRPIGDQSFRVDRSLNVEPFTVIDAVLPSGFLHFRPGERDVGLVREGRLVAEIVLAMAHDAYAQWPAKPRNGSRRYEANRWILEDFLLGSGRPRVGILLAESSHFGWIRIIDGFDRRPRLSESIAHPVDMPMIETDYAYLELARLADRR